MSNRYSNNDDDDDSDFVPSTPKDLEQEAQKNMDDFTGLLETLSSLHDKKKSLWKQIYNNAVLDRRNAYIMFNDLYQKVHNSPAEHAIHGQTLSKYLERMNKSNEQIIRLAEILDEAIETDEEDITDENDIYDRFEAKNRK